MTGKDTTKLIELLRTFINSPCRTKADAELLEAKLAEFEKETTKPEKRVFATVVRAVKDEKDADWFNQQLSEGSSFGYKIEACGSSSSGLLVLWAIMSKPAEEE